jgi:hypothetical protein
MKFFFVVLCIFISLSGCTPKDNSGQKIAALEKKVDSLDLAIHKIKPGLGEIMSGIQVHHEKLWFAGINENWDLTEYETGELKEAFEQARDIEKDRPEIKNLPMIFPAIDSLTVAINNKDLAGFKTAYFHLDATCNSCHKASNHVFNVITTPAIPPVSDQEFKPRK